MNKRVLFLIPSLRCNDGIAVTIMNYYTSLINAGWNVDFMLVEEGEHYEWYKNIKKHNGNVYRLPNVNKYSSIIKTNIENIMEKGQYDIVHVNIPGHVALVTFKIAKKNNVNIRIFHCHNPKNTLTIKTKMSTFIYDHLCLPKATHFIACSNSTGISRFGQHKFKIIKNVINPEKFKFDIKKRTILREKIGVSDNFVVGVVARISAQKNPDFILQCFSKFQEKQKNAKLVWIGDGNLEKSVKKSIELLGLSDKCILLGKKDNVEDWYSTMDLFLLPSKFEGLGIVFLEAQCSGLPCLGSTTVPVETEVTNLMHRFDLNKSASQWAEEMVKIARMKEKRYSRIQEFVNAGYTHESTKHDLVKYYDSLIK